MTDSPPSTPSGAEATFEENIEKVRTLLATARRLMGEGRFVDLAQIEVKVESLCAQARTLTEERRPAAAEILQDLLGEIDATQSDLETQFGAALSERPHREAARAYDKAGTRGPTPPHEKGAEHFSDGATPDVDAPPPRTNNDDPSGVA